MELLALFRRFDQPEGKRFEAPRSGTPKTTCSTSALVLPVLGRNAPPKQSLRRGALRRDRARSARAVAIEEARGILMMHCNGPLCVYVSS